MKILYQWKTKRGLFFIGQSDDGRFHPIYNNESLGSYAYPHQAAEDLAGGHTFSVPGISDTATLGIPEHHEEWEKVH